MTWTCPTRNCRRTDPHDAKGCVVAWDAADAAARHLDAVYEQDLELFGVVVPDHSEPANFMPRSFKP